MKKLCIISAIFLLSVFSFQAFGQLSLGAGAGMFKHIKPDIDASYGPEVTLKFDMTEKLRIGANLSYYFRNDEITAEYSRRLTRYFMPISGLLEYSFSKGGINPYLGMNVGTYIIGSRMDGESNSEAYLGFAPVGGLDIDISDNFVINARAKFHLYFFENYYNQTKSMRAFGIDISIFYRF